MFETKNEKIEKMKLLYKAKEYEQAYELAKKVDNLNYMISCCNYLKKDIEAIEHFKRLKSYKDLSNRELGFIYFNVAFAYDRIGDKRTSFRLARMSMAICQEIAEEKDEQIILRWFRKELGVNEE